MSSLAGAQSGGALSAPLTGADEASAAERSAKRGPSRVILHISRHSVAGEKIRASGRVRPRGRRWVTVRIRGLAKKTVRTRRNGRFRVGFRANRLGSYKAFASVSYTKRLKHDRTPPKRVNVYRYAHASYYGPGFYGNRTACGQTLSRGTVGVAHKTLPCGTKVTFRNAGRTVRIRVIDRGPYVAGRDYDLTEAAKERLRFGSTGTVLATK